MSSGDMLTPLVAYTLRFSPGDHVDTLFGHGIVCTPSDGQDHVGVALTCGGILYARRTCLIPKFRMLMCGEIPMETRVICLPNGLDQVLHGTIHAYLLQEQVYKVHVDKHSLQDEETIVFVSKDLLRLASNVRVRTNTMGLGVIQAYRHESDSYVIQLDFGGIGYFSVHQVTPVDLRLLSKLPTPMSAEAIYQEFQGRISVADAQGLYNKALAWYKRILQMCERHADMISCLSTNASYCKQYMDLLSTMIDPTLSQAMLQLKEASLMELEKLKAIVSNVKTAIENELLEGKDVSTFINQATNVLSQLQDSTEVQQLQSKIRVQASNELKNAKQQIEEEDIHQQPLVLSQIVSVLEEKVDAQRAKFQGLSGTIDHEKIMTFLLQHETELIKARDLLLHVEKVISTKLGVSSITNLKPTELVTHVTKILPKLTAHADLLKESGKGYLTQIQYTSHGQSVFTQAKQLVQSIENPDAFCQQVQDAVNEIQLDKLTAWGTTLTTNRQKRQDFIDRVKDHCLDFFMSVLPTMQVDTIAGIEEGVEYSISNLDLSNFRVKKECVKVRMGTVADEELFTVRATHLTALLRGFSWTFAQKYFPYAHGGGLADAALSGGVISLGFKAEKKVVNAETGEFKPTLVLNSMEIEIKQELKLTVQGSWFSAVYNLLTSMFAALIREYLAKTMESKLLRHMIKLLTALNDQMEKYWPLVFQLLDIRVEDLPSASPWRGAKEVDIQPHEVDCEILERGILPFTFTRGVLNRAVVVSPFPSTTDKKGNTLVSSKKPRTTPISSSSSTQEIFRVPLGAPVMAINGLACHKLTLDEFTTLLETLPLPYTLRFSLIPEDTSKIRQRTSASSSRPTIVQVVFKQEGPFGMRLRNRPLAPYGAIVLGFADIAKGVKGPAELCGKIHPGYILTKINDIDVRCKPFTDILELMKTTTKRPTTLTFASSPDGIIKLKEWPPMLEWEASDEESPDGRNYVVISAFTRVPSFAQKTHQVERGDVLWKVNNMELIAPTIPNFAAIMEQLKILADAKEPMHAVFVQREDYISVIKARKAHEMNPTEQVQEEFTVLKEIIFPKPPLGILFGNWKDEAAYIRSFISSAGPAERSGIISIGHAILQICGENVPCDATPTVIEHMIQHVTHQDKDGSSTRYSITLRDLEMEREIMK